MTRISSRAGARCLSLRPPTTEPRAPSHAAAGERDASACGRFHWTWGEPAELCTAPGPQEQDERGERTAWVRRDQSRVIPLRRR